MAWESPGLTISLPCVTTGLKRYQYGSITTGGAVVACTTDLIPVGIIQDGSTGSTVLPEAVSVMVSGVSKLVLDSASTVGVGQLISASTVGGKTSVAGDFVAGLIIAGTSGGADRVVSVLLAAPNYSTAIA